MKKEQIGNIIKEIREKQPLVYHITNTVTINDCANITLSMGGSPLMSFCEEELEEILSFTSALVINIGTMDKQMCNIVVKAGEIANKLGVPVVLDPVGVGASKARKELIDNLLKNVKFSVIKGNLAEIKSIAGLKNMSNRGVDSIEILENADEMAKELALKLDTVIAITGKDDIISDGKRIAIIKNGTHILGKVTGTGCMTASLIGCACGTNKDYMLGATLGVSLMGIAGELSEKSLDKTEGNGTLKVKILDNIYNMTKEKFIENEKIILENF
ncbi:hydroxyethylthiazole kinase [Fusobacterium sp. FSA-380-WT-3A]|nr:hydroxyethylthiazole kinase [Fusobacterium sp. FSA-380-WT-3A]